MAVFSRSQWGAAPPKRASRKDDPGNGMAVHHLGDGLPARTSLESAMATLRSVQQGHLNHATENYSDIAYNMAVDQLGNIYELRGMDVEGGATYGANDTVRAVLWLGDSDVSTPTVAALQAIAAVYQTAVAKGHLINGASIGGHKDWSSTGCPGERLYRMLPHIRALAGGRDIIIDDPLILNPASEEPELDANQAAQLKASADVLTPVWERIKRPVTLADIAEMNYDNFVKIGAALAQQQATNAQILATLQSIDAKLGAVSPGPALVPTAADLVEAFIQRLQA